MIKDTLAVDSEFADRLISSLRRCVCRSLFRSPQWILYEIVQSLSDRNMTTEYLYQEKSLL